MKQSTIFEVYEDSRRKRYTLNLSPGKKVYDEALVKENGREYREWNPRRSKLCAAIQKGCQNIFMRKGHVVLYLGSSTGTTVSHVSDIVGKEGLVFAVDFAPRVMRELVFLAEERNNIAPILADANRPDLFSPRVCAPDILYQDIAQRNQVDIFLKNIKAFLKDDGYALLAVKARSIDVTKRPRDIFTEVHKILEQSLTIVDVRTLEPLEMDHAFFICKQKKKAQVTY